MSYVSKPKLKHFLLEVKKDPNCKGVIYRIPWGKFVDKDKKQLSDLLTSPGYAEMNFNTHYNIKKILNKYPDPNERLN
tara:strand:+ start:402 stop:635 length:234 start_codon:yes stop_codon:yes gene_type:complete